MWFRNLMVYRFSSDVEYTQSELEEALVQRHERECGSQETHTLGFAKPLGRHSVMLAHEINKCFLIAVRKHERMLPSSVVKDALSEKVDEIENREGRKVYKKERDTLKDDIIMALLPRAFIRSTTTYAILDPTAGLIYVDSSSASKSEDLLSLLREVLGTLPVRPLSVKMAPYACMTSWVKEGQAPSSLRIADDAVLSDTCEDGGNISAKRQDLSSQEIQQHLESGKQITQLKMGWDGKISFNIDDKLTIKQLRFEDLLQDEADDMGGEDMAGQLDAALTIMTSTFREFIPQLAEAMGGEDSPQGI